MKPPDNLTNIADILSPIQVKHRLEDDWRDELKNGDARNDRALFGLTASRNISNGLALSLGLVWANRPEFRGIVDQELTAKLAARI